MKLRIAKAKNGLDTCLHDGRLLHSAQDPRREAERFLETSLGEREVFCAVLGGPCLDYLTPLLRARRQGIKVVVVQFSPEFRGMRVETADATWYQDDEEKLESFLERTLGDEAEGGLAYLEWKPAAQEFPEMADRLRRALRTVLDRLSGTAATTRLTGRRWIVNACRSFLLLDHLVELANGDWPIVIAGAGPSLEDACAVLIGLRSKYLLLAVSSALPALRARGFEPDLVIATDAGFWSRLHLYPLKSRGIPLASPLSALPSASLDIEHLLIDQGWFPESELASLLGAAIAVPSHGTVTGSALALASRLTRGPLIAAGFDFAAHGEITHARPHGFDSWKGRREGRRRPKETLIVGDARETHPAVIGNGPWRSSRAHSSYASALIGDAACLGRALFRMTPSPVDLPGFAPIDRMGLVALLEDPHFLPPLFVRKRAPPREVRIAQLRKSIGLWQAGAEFSIEGLLLGRLPDERVAQLLRSVDLPDWVAARKTLLSKGDPGPAALALRQSVRTFLSDLVERLV